MSIRKNIEALNEKIWQNDLVSIKPLETEKELIYIGYECTLSESQKEMVNPVWFTMGRAYLFKEKNYPCVIYNKNNLPVGFINFYEWSGSSDAYSWSFFIDEKEQGKGYGKSAGKLAIEILQKACPNIIIKLATEQSNIKAQRLYQSLGFKESSEKDGDDIVYVL